MKVLLCISSSIFDIEELNFLRVGEIYKDYTIEHHYSYEIYYRINGYLYDKSRFKEFEINDNSELETIKLLYGNNNE